MVFLVAENENRQLEDLPQADFGREHENISLVGISIHVTRVISCTLVNI